MAPRRPSGSTTRIRRRRPRSRSRSRPRATGTLVELEHRGFEKHGEAGAEDAPRSSPPRRLDRPAADVREGRLNAVPPASAGPLRCPQMYVSMSRLRIPVRARRRPGRAPSVRASRLVDDADGFVDLQVWQSDRDDGELIMVSRWRSIRDAFKAYMRSPRRVRVLPRPDRPGARRTRSSSSGSSTCTRTRWWRSERPAPRRRAAGRRPTEAHARRRADRARRRSPRRSPTATSSASRRTSSATATPRASGRSTTRSTCSTGRSCDVEGFVDLEQAGRLAGRRARRRATSRSSTSR